MHIPHIRIRPKITHENDFIYATGHVMYSFNFTKNPNINMRNGNQKGKDKDNPNKMAQEANNTPPPRAWQRMLSGRRLDLINPAPADIEIEDIAHGLSRVARWNGQTTGEHPFSVAQHSLLVEEIFSRLHPQTPAWALLAALLHDAPEYVIGDMISPFKAVLGGGYKAFENRLQHAIHLRFCLPAALPESLQRQIKHADTLAAWLEATQLAGFSREEALRVFGPEPEGFGDITLHTHSTGDIKALFLDRFHALIAQHNI